MAKFVPSSSPPPPPDQEPNLGDARVVADLLRRATGCAQSPCRQGAMVQLPNRGRLVMTGDLHDHGRNFRRILQLAALHQDPNHYLILHEVIHGPNRVNGCDTSIRTLARAAALMLRYPDQVHVVLANHDLAQRNNEGILKRGANVVEAFDQGMKFIYNGQAQLVRDAMKQFFTSLPLAVRCPNGVFCSHSLPSPQQLETFDPHVIHRTPTAADLAAGGHAHRMVWGRRHTQTVADVLGHEWDASLFVMGHQPAASGYQPEGNSMLILASDHEHGMALPIDLEETYTQSQLINQLIPLASVTP